MSIDMRKSKWVPSRTMLRIGLGVAMLGVLALGGCGMLMSGMHGGAERPAAEEFGFGPRTSAGGSFRATIEPMQALGVGRMQSVRLRVEDAAGRAVDGAAIQVDGGMPQHGHGLPTRPRVTRSLGDGAYQVDGLKFNMGGWWEVKFRVAGAAGTDSVTFNLEL